MKGRFRFLIAFFLAIVAVTDAETPTDSLMIISSKDHFYLLLPEAAFRRPVLVVTRIVESPAGIKRFPLGGDEAFDGSLVNKAVFTFRRLPGGKVAIESENTEECASDTSAGNVFFDRSHARSIYGVFQTDPGLSIGGSTAIDVTLWLESDNEQLYFPASFKSSLVLGAYQADKSFISRIYAFSAGAGLIATKTYIYNKGDIRKAQLPVAKFASFVLNMSCRYLPDVPMSFRLRDERVGSFSQDVTDYTANSFGSDVVQMVKRWRLEPKRSEINLYQSGVLVQPENPIVFYIDDGVPKKWVQYFLRAVAEWEPVFRAAGFKNAIVGRRMPSIGRDSGFNRLDPRLNVIYFQANDEKNSSYSTVVDPRTGEILQSNILMYQGILKALRNQYFVQASPSDPSARRRIFDDTLIGHLLENVCAHEIGHALGFPHNMGASASVPTDSLRSRHWVAENGICPSIMDYSRYNYVAQPGDSIRTFHGLVREIGVYDVWAIRWAYSYLPAVKPGAVAECVPEDFFNEIRDDERYWYGGEANEDDPRVRMEDLGDDAIKSGEFGVANLKYVMDHLKEWTAMDRTNKADVLEIYNTVVEQFGYYVDNVAALVGGIEISPEGTSGLGVAHGVSVLEQRRAIEFIKHNLFMTPEWLVAIGVVDGLGANREQILGRLQTLTFNNSLLSSRTLKNLVQSGRRGGKLYSLRVYLEDLGAAVWEEIASGKDISQDRRMLQLRYLDGVGQVVGMTARDPTSDYIAAELFDYLSSLKRRVEGRRAVSDESLKAYLYFVSRRITVILDNFKDKPLQ